jgi:hypothetical protein
MRWRHHREPRRLGRIPVRERIVAELDLAVIIQLVHGKSTIQQKRKALASKRPACFAASTRTSAITFETEASSPAPKNTAVPVVPLTSPVSREEALQARDHFCIQARHRTGRQAGFRRRSQTFETPLAGGLRGIL